MKKLIVLFLLCMPFFANAWTFIGNMPPATHSLLEGAYKKFASTAGAVRYYRIVENTKCNTVPTMDEWVSSTYSIPKAGLYKQYKSPTGVIGRYPVSFADDCVIVLPSPPPPVIDNTCEGIYVCRKDWGWVVRVTPAQILQCQELKVSSANVAIYEALQKVNGVYQCPSTP